MIENNDVPYANLTPDLILDAIEQSGFRCSGGLLALNSYENRVYQIGIDDAEPVIAKFYRPNRWSDAAILEEHYFASELTEFELPIVAPLVMQERTLHHFKEFRFAIFPRKGGRALELDNLDQLEWMGRFVGRLHSVSKNRVFQHRIQISIKNYGYNPYYFLIKNNFIPDHLKKNYSTVVEAILKKIEEIFHAAEPVQQIRLHGDCHAGNVLWNNEGPQIVDLDDCLMGPAIQDIWMLLSGEEDQMHYQLDCILEGYQQFADFNYRELKLIEPLRTLRMIMYSGWLAVRWNDPAFQRSFPWFNTGFYWEEQLQHLDNQLELLVDQGS